MAEASSASSLASLIDRNYLECSICTGPFDDPRALPCLHPFCCGCLENWAKTYSKDGKIVSCPLCKKVYRVPEEEGIKGFPAHFLVADLQNTVDKAKQKSDDVCANHGKKTEYYCESCDCPACSDCGILDPTHGGHSFIRLSDAAQRQIGSLEPLIRGARNVEDRYVRSIQQAEQVEQDIDRAVYVKLNDIDEARNELIQQVDKLIGTLKQDVHKKKEEKMGKLQQTKEKLQVDLATIRHSCELATNVVESGSHSDVISLYPSLSSSLQQVAQSQPSTVDSTLSQLHFDPPQQIHGDVSSLEQLLCDTLNITLPSWANTQASNQTSRHLPAAILPVTMKPAVSRFSLFSRFRSVRQPRKDWKECGQIKTTLHVRFPRGIAIHPNGDFAVTSNYAPVTVFSRNGDFTHVIKGFPRGIFDIAITPSNQYIIPGKYSSNEFYIYDSQCVLHRTIPTYDINNKPCTPNSVAVDSTGRIVVGFGYTCLQEDKTVSIHQPNGTLISEFETRSAPRKLTCTPDDRLIISFDDTLQVMDQSGHNVRIIHPPPGIQSWKPWYVCCSKQGELFVSNTNGDPEGVYRYVFTGREYKYLDCIITGWHPCGIALSADEEKLFAVDYANDAIKIFQ